jgi:hypothetical protein
MFGFAALCDSVGLPRDLDTGIGIVLAGVALGVWAGLASRFH